MPEPSTVSMPPLTTSTTTSSSPNSSATTTTSTASTVSTPAQPAPSYDSSPPAATELAPFYAEAPGELPTESVVKIGGETLPKGHLVWTNSDEQGAPVMWISDGKSARAGALVAELQKEFPNNGLWPLVIVGENGGPDFESSIQSVDDELSEPDVSALLTATYADTIGDKFASLTEYVGPFTESFPGLAAPTTGQINAKSAAQSVQNVYGWVVLVPVTRPADVPLAIGWTGSASYYDPAEMTTILRSWEDRLGAVVTVMGWNYLWVSTVRQPASEAETLAVAGEFMGACPDSLLQDYDNFDGYLSDFGKYTDWFCWWD